MDSCPPCGFCLQPHLGLSFNYRVIMDLFIYLFIWFAFDGLGPPSVGAVRLHFFGFLPFSLI